MNSFLSLSKIPTATKSKSAGITNEISAESKRTPLLYPHRRPWYGQTSVLQELRDQGHACVDEPTRQILSSQLAIDGRGLPAKNPLLFVQLMLRQCIENFQARRSSSGLVFFDRGIPDLIAYAIRFGVDPSEFQRAAHEYLYNHRVFVFPPWKEIFVNDNERRLTYEMSLRFQDLLIESYQKLGFELIEVPKGSPAARTAFILESASCQSLFLLETKS